jgi:hypothetical protein
VARTADTFERITIIITNNFVENCVLIPLSAVLLGMVNVYYAVFLFLWAAVFVAGS